MGRPLARQLAPLAGDGSYSVDFIIPADVGVGAVELCALVVGADNAEFACAPLQIDPVPAIPVSGRLPVGATLVGQARLSLYAAAGHSEYTAPIGEDGTFQLAKVMAGRYNYAVTGGVSQLVANGAIEIQPSATGAKIDLTSVPAIENCFATLKPRNAGRITAHPSRTTDAAPFGIYISNVSNLVTFEAFPQTSGPVQRVRFKVVDRNFQVIDTYEVTRPPWRWQFDVSRLPPSSRDSHATIFATPIVAGEEACPALNDIQVVANPFAKTGFQPNAIVWDKAARVYRIEATIPYIRDILPGEFNFSLPYFGSLNNRFNTGIQVLGTINLDGFAHLTLVQAILETQLMNHTVFPRGQRLAFAQAKRLSAHVRV